HRPFALVTHHIMPDLEEFDRCLVCDAPVTSTHYGVDACRACSLFFKRAMIVTGIQYPCRQGAYSCTVAKDGKFVCRRCRFDKCIAVGMFYDGPTKIRELRVAIPLLLRVGKEFKALNERRRVKELKVMRKCGLRMPHPTEEIYYVSAQASADIYTIAIVEALTFFENAFPTLRQLERRERESIFKDFMIKLNLISGYHGSRRLWKNCRTKAMLSAVTCYDTDFPVDFSAPGAADNKEPFKMSIRAHIDDHVNMFMPLLERLRLKEEEYHALAALTMTDQDVQLSERAQRLLDDIRTEIFANLHAYYRNDLALKDYSTRLGNLMSLNHTAQEVCSIFRVFFRFYFTIFDLHMADRAMAECFL
ncbi:hypothetical protein PRIPAC_82539, partial [Pristionchus pacificus]